MLDFQNIEVSEMSDEEIAITLASSGKGKPAIYAPILAQLNAQYSADKNWSLTVPFDTLNPEAKERQTVLSGIRQAAKKAESGSRFNFMASGECDVRILLAAVKNETENK